MKIWESLEKLLFTAVNSGNYAFVQSACGGAM